MNSNQPKFDGNSLSHQIINDKSELRKLQENRMKFRRMLNRCIGKLKFSDYDFIWDLENEANRICRRLENRIKIGRVILKIQHQRRMKN